MSHILSAGTALPESFPQKSPPSTRPQIAAQPSTAAAESPVVDQVDTSSTRNEAAAETEPAGAGVTEMDPCAVCTFVDDKDPRAYLPCGHSMHPRCIKGWVETLSDQSLAHAPGAGPTPGVISAASSCMDCLDDVDGYDQFDDEDDEHGHDESENQDRESVDPQSHGKPCSGH
ncbi:hypothetical protein LQW54_000893 [Pestalotiopsis sp. IQ-011]